MMFSTIANPGIAIPSLILLISTAMLLLLGRNWRWMSGALAVQYFGVFVFTSFSWPLLIALVKLVAGWMAVLVLWVTVANTSESWPQEQAEASGRIFRVLAAGITLSIVFAASQEVYSWIPGVDLGLVTGSLILGGLGLLHLGLTTQPLRVIIGLLTVLSGFEILYAGLENSLLVAGLLAGLNLGIALVGAYITILPHVEEPPV